MAEHRSPKPGVAGSIPVSPAVSAEDLSFCQRRRSVLRLVAGGLAGGVLLELGALVGCGGAKGPIAATVPLAELPIGARKVVALGDIPVEIQRTQDRFIARSLLCTHEGCVVAWQEDLKRYKCPCQGGWFDADGQPFQGPVTKPLVEYPVAVSGDSITLTAS